MVNVSLSKLYPTLLAILTYINPKLKTDENGHITHVEINKDPLPKNLTLDTYLDAINFTLYTQENPTDGEILKLNDVESVQNSHWNATKQTIIVTHGWTNRGEDPVCTTIRDGFLKVRDCNVIILDWSVISDDLVYSVVAEIVPYVAERTASFINFMRIEAGLQTSNLKIVGHSFGAQIAGLSAREVGKSSRVAEVIALDPANVMFQHKKPGERVDKSDAENVQIIHTCSGQFGYYLSVGTSDFYANDGRHQPGCGIDFFGVCAHLRSYKFFAESITNPKGFLGTRADGATAYMGGATLDPTAKGTYYFKTNSQYPYALDG
ncbi:pancreatic triacylglycerol lipase-like [Bombus pyrosoma]|uniref:pancreatic triacylglycerol lipase-like n=1 Tax=Bombus pyrosoma TaxID=396416 RepID=UPI001CB8FDCB|nr:pancreatic triacylglycerol lipase-like [Bombus pyrosoma]